MRKLLMLLLLTLSLLLTAQAAVPLITPDSDAGQCLAALQDWTNDSAMFLADGQDRLMIVFPEGEAIAAAQVDDATVLCGFYYRDDEWFVDWINDYHPFGVDETGADLQPDFLLLQEDVLTWRVTDGETAAAYTASPENDWDPWLVTGSTHYALTEGQWVETARVDEPIAMLPVFGIVPEEQEPVIIEGNILVCYPESRVDAHYTVPDGVEIIGEYAFSSNTNLLRVTLPESVRIIGDDAFFDCWSLRQVDMPSTLEYLGCGAFGQTNLQRCVIPEGVTELPSSVYAAASLKGTVVIPEGVTDIDWECFVFGYGITDMYLPASLETIGGETFQQGAEFWNIWGFNSVDAGETHMTVHAPAGTEAARFAIWSGESYVIEDAREGTDLATVTGWVQAVLDETLPGAAVCTNEYGFPCVTYSADTVFAFAAREAVSRYDEDEVFLCCFDRTGNALTLRWVNADSDMTAPLDMTLIGNKLTLMLRLGEETAATLSFSGEDFRLSRVSVCIWEKDTGGPPPGWATMLMIPVTDGTPLQVFSTWDYGPHEEVVQGAVFDGDTVLLSLYDVVHAATDAYPFTYEHRLRGLYRFELTGVEYEMNESAMTLTRCGEDDPINLVKPAPGAEDFRSEIIDGRWMVDANTVYCTFRSFLDWPIRISIDYDTQTVTVSAE